VLVDQADKLKKACTRKKSPRPPEVLAEIIEEAQSLKDWTLEEKIEHSQVLAGSVDINLIITKQIKAYLESNGIGSVDEWRDENNYYWAVVKRSQVAKTKTGKPYLRMQVYGESGQEQGCFIWGFNPKRDKIVPNNTLILAKFKKSDFGLSTHFTKLEVIERNDD